VLPLDLSEGLGCNKTHNSINAVASISGTAITLLHVSAMNMVCIIRDVMERGEDQRKIL
jgi:hypothetical protein